MKQYLPSMVKFVTIVFGMWLATLALTTVTKNKFQALEAEKAEMQKVRVVTSDERARQLRCLTQNIYWEAASEPFEGKVAVAQVTMNRVQSGKFADNVCGVVKQKNSINGSIVCQFSWVCESVKSIVRNKYQWEESLVVAKKALTQAFAHDLLYEQDAMYFHATYVQPGWKRVKVKQIGNHIFYK